MKYGSIEESTSDGQPTETYIERRSRYIANTIRVTSAVLFIVLVTFVLTTSSGALKSLSASTATGLASSSSSSSARGATTSFTYSSLSDTEQEALFASFISHYGKTYTTESDEYPTRLSNFKAFLTLVDERNANEAAALGEGIHGITKFSDLSQEEFEATYLMSFYEEDGYSGTDADDADRRGRRLSGATKEQRSERQRRVQSEQLSLLAKYTEKKRRLQQKQQQQRQGKRHLQEVGADMSVTSTVSTVDWSTSLTTAVNDQGSGCPAASWAFAAAQQIESDAVRKGYITLADTLSVQQLLDCNTDSNGCTSGSLESAYEYSSKPGALHTAAQYPYVSSSGECTSADSDYAATLGSYATVTKYHNEETGYSTTQVESNMLAHLVATGTLSACIDASILNTYTSGSIASCVGTTINYCTQVVGVTYDSIADVGYYKLRMSWADDYGESGYIKLAHGVNACYVVYNPGYTDPAASLGR